ncbi:MAG: [Fe-Fe] hydrogenase large subunit C-terminal domain-containing protein [Caulobacteraceae bacterium]
MNLLNFSKANCKNCYRCLRSCPVKAIQFKDEQAIIIEDRCIACGQCLTVCPQDARYVRSDLAQIKEAISSGRIVAASLAPSFAGAFEMSYPEQLVSAMKLLGFAIVEETAVGADLVTGLYKGFIHSKKKKNLITTCCPAANYLIEKYYPSLIQYMIPVVSPMLAHSKLIRYGHGGDCFVVFVGPCIAKKAEVMSMQNIGTVDAVLTFEELNQWLLEENIDLMKLPESAFDKVASWKGSQYPVPGGVAGSFSDKNEEQGYEIIKADGIDNCLEIFHALESGVLQNVCVEVSICRNGCIGGPGMPKNERNCFERLHDVKKYVLSKQTSCGQHTETASMYKSIDFSKTFFDKRIQASEPEEAEIKKILAKMGKHSPGDELNCGACGYNTCREKAKAVFEGMAEMHMCLPYMRSKAESLTNVIFEHSPNVIMLVDENLKIKELNPTSERLFKVKTHEVKDKPLALLIDDTDFAKVISTKQNIYKQKVTFPDYGLVFMRNLVYLEKQNLVMAIMMDITLDEKNRQELSKVKENTLEAAQTVITKQMRVAQEIASLLGETTAETKIILTKLKEIVLGENGDLE